LDQGPIPEVGVESGTCLHRHAATPPIAVISRAIKRYLASRTDALPWLFISERGQPLTRQSVNYLLAESAAAAGLPPVHPHMLRHSCGFSLANCGYDLRLIQDYLEHRDPKHTVHYTRVAAGRFEGLWL
jgi:type 1 fimbriae regulatory protein FimB